MSYKILWVLDGHFIFERGRSPQFNILPTAWIFHKGDTANQTNHHDIETSKISFLSFAIRAILVLRQSKYFSFAIFTWHVYLTKISLSWGRAHILMITVWYYIRVVRQMITVLHGGGLANDYSTPWILGYSIWDIISIDLTKKSIFFSR